jgi:hypothetical protein
LAVLTAAKEYSGRLDPFNVELRESDGGMTAVVYVQPDSDNFVIEVKGAEPEPPQAADLRLSITQHNFSTAA